MIPECLKKRIPVFNGDNSITFKHIYHTAMSLGSCGEMLSRGCNPTSKTNVCLHLEDMNKVHVHDPHSINTYALSSHCSPLNLFTYLSFLILWWPINVPHSLHVCYYLHLTLSFSVVLHIMTFNFLHSENIISYKVVIVSFKWWKSWNNTTAILL